MSDKSVRALPSRPRLDLPSEQTRDVRARAWTFVFKCHARKKASRPGGPDDAKEFRNDRTAEPEYNR